MARPISASARSTSSSTSPRVLIDRYGEQVQNGGFKVYTTIDPALQSVARRTIGENLYYDDDPDGAVVMIDSQKGFIRAMASSQRFNEENQFGLATQAPPAGLGLQDVRADRGDPTADQPVFDTLRAQAADFTDDHYGPIDVETLLRQLPGAIPSRRPHSARTTRSSSS